jgi:hypothetical protein
VIKTLFNQLLDIFMQRQSMNHVFRVIWNMALGCWVAVAEVSSARGKASRSKKAGVALSATLLTLGALADPVAGPPSAVDLDTFFQSRTVVNGNGGSGCMVGISIAACGTPSSISDVTFTDFLTKGGAGSGGGAGLGGGSLCEHRRQFDLDQRAVHRQRGQRG